MDSSLSPLMLVTTLMLLASYDFSFFYCFFVFNFNLQIEKIDFFLALVLQTAVFFFCLVRNDFVCPLLQNYSSFGHKWNTYWLCLFFLNYYFMQSDNNCSWLSFFYGFNMIDTYRVHRESTTTHTKKKNKNKEKK